MMEAERLHREVALLSNSLHTFPDDETIRVMPVIAEIREKRNAWKVIRMQILHFEKFGELPQEDDQPTESAESGGESLSDLMVTLQKLNVNIWKHEQKIAEKDGHRKQEQWQSELEKMKAQKIDIRKQIIKKKYAKP